MNLEVFLIETPAGPAAAQGDNQADAGIRKVLVQTLGAAFDRGLSRERVAELMSAVLGRNINQAHLDLWCAPSQLDRRIPVDALMAMMAVCNDYAPLEWVAKQSGRKVLTESEALCAEFGAMAVIDRHIKARQKVIEGRMDETLARHLMGKLKVGQE